ncbi:DEAD/DEAH box helicase [Glycomyces xiaoerkulensis]|uniref:DEAD/DEAH box helicase n=1 Tax=Glycomyces xiaoerkulensis TaxID=2038139 RepID=UPI000C262658|nr:DEAD/DEAH box helicase [Glycomyces xiaoerkulensis]
MKPSLAALRMRDQVVEYLATTYGMTGESARELERFLTDPEDGIVKGPFLRLRTPFRPASPGWESDLDWLPEGFTPHRHQANAWSRLSSKRHEPQPTIVTTGTGSGKTESFLIPILDHCRRHADSSNPGVKAVFLYPMNALAADQAKRLNEMLSSDPRLSDVTAGLYIGDKAEVTYERILTERRDIQATPPDILITNYKMLDLILQRPVDAALFGPRQLTYIVVDEFHTYDGAQGTDVAMLLRRLNAAVGDRPVCPVATSATLASGEGADDLIREVAEDVFGVPFAPDSVIVEDRLDSREFIEEPDDDEVFNLPTPEEFLGISGDPVDDPAALAELTGLVCGRRDLTPVELGAKLKRHPLTRVLLDVFTDGQVRDLDAIFAAFRRGLVLDSWVKVFRTDRALASEALARYLALLSVARDPDFPSRPLLKVETHLWLKAIHRVLRQVSHAPRFHWDSDDSLSEALVLPAIACRHCGRSGWMALSPEQDPEDLKTEAVKIYRATVRKKTKSRLRALTAAAQAECDAVTAEEPHLKALDLAHLRTLDPLTDKAVDAPRPEDAEQPADASEAIPVWVNLESDAAAREDRCPACNRDNGIRFIGTGAVTLASVVVTELFTRSLEPDLEARKTLAFSDSVQDAAHRAGFLSSRSHSFSLRSHLAKQLPDDKPRGLDELAASALEALPETAELSAVVPVELHDQTEVKRLLEGTGEGTPAAWRLIADRVSFDTFLEFGLRSRLGRTLETTRTAAAEVALPDPDLVAGIARDVLQTCRGDMPLELPSPELFFEHARGLLERLRGNGAIKHRWLDQWITTAGAKPWSIWGGRPPGMPAFPDTISRPEFGLGEEYQKKGFTPLTRRGTWYADWTRRTLGLAESVSAQYLPRLLSALADSGLIAARTISGTGTRVFGLTPGHIAVTGLSSDAAAEAIVACDVCDHRLTVVPERRDSWAGTRCPRWRCQGRLRPREAEREDFYRRIYREKEVFRVRAVDHTGVLTREQREKVERDFQGDGFDDPNVLSATSTLELGIDIGDLSAVILAGLPPAPAGYAQRSGRAGRKTGNALTVTVADRRPRDRHFFADPSLMLDAAISPPGAYLSAVEILKRQYTAFLLDKAGRGELPGVGEPPRLASALFGDTGWLAQFSAAARTSFHTTGAEFLDLFGDKLSERVTDELRDWFGPGLEKRLEIAAADWEARLAHLRDRIAQIETAAGELTDPDGEDKGELRQLRAEAAGIRRRFGDIGRTPAHNALVEFGLLPNYALIDTATTLEATLTNVEETSEGDKEYTSELREYPRPARQALTEIAPGSTFYARGYQHAVRGLDVGTRANPAWEEWRICPGCGHVRTHEAAADLSPCERCGTAMNDNGELYRVLRPVRSWADDRNDDAHISDARDDRLNTYYNTVDTVDIAHVSTGWHHRSAAFGADYAPEAVVRRFNLGLLRPERRDSFVFAGKDTDINWFWVCPECGGTGTDEDPSLKQDHQFAGRGDAAREHHRRWCRNRTPNTGHQKIILAHELPTETLRILVPVLTFHQAEKLASFQAALKLGLAAVYKGDPSHLATVTATMPDTGTRDIRNFVVLFDQLPSGTGYLDRLSQPDALRSVLAAARERLEACDCKQHRACHRCLLAHTPQNDYEHVSRGTAIEMLAELLDDWGTEPVSGVHDISLLRLTESELEQRFLDKLRRYAARTDGVRLIDQHRDEAELLLTGADDRPVRWKVRLQKRIEGTIPDAEFTRLDAESETVAFYLDGYAFHASAEHNRLADDAYKRSTLHAHGYRVFAATWDDVETWLDPDAESPWPPYRHDARRTADEALRNLGGEPGDLTRSCTWGNPLDLLMAYLKDPDAERWARRTAATVMGLATKASKQTMATSAGVAPAVDAAVDGRDLPVPEDGRIAVLSAVDGNDLPMAICIDARSAGRQPLTAIAVLDDSAAAIGRTEEHKRRWKSWLYWANLLQFLPGQGGDGVQETTSGLREFDPFLLTVCEGTGLLAALADAPPVDLGDGHTSAEGRDRVSSSRIATGTVDASYEWPGVRLSLVADARTYDLALALQAAGALEPEIGVDYVDGYTAELVWPAQKVAVISVDDPGEEAEALSAYRDAGWAAEAPTEWTAESLLHTLQQRTES